ncbi:MAG: hypothetical protein ACLQLG_18485 [Thermoguttaceae bacterium]
MEETSENNRQAGDSEAERRPWQFSLWSLMVLTTLLAVLCSLVKSLGLLLFTLLFLLLLPVWDILQEGKHRR